MSSTHFNVGLLEGRSSSRVLKPPGGGHSDIFGRPDSPEKPRNAKANNNASGIHACLNHQHQENERSAKVQSQQNGNGNGHGNGNHSEMEDRHIELTMNGTSDTKATNGGSNGVSAIEEPIHQENVENAVPQIVPEVCKAQMTPQKTRIPPGGFSSGFW